MSPRRLLVVSVSLGYGGAERFTSILLQHLDRARFEPHLCLLRDQVTYALPDDVGVTVLHKHHPYHIPRTIIRLRSLIRRLQPQVVLGNMLATDWLVGAALSGLPRRTDWVTRFAAPPALGGTLLDRLANPYLRHVVGGATCWVANSKALADELRGWGAGERPPVTTIHNPVDVAAIEEQGTAPLEREGCGPGPHLVWVGRLEPQKRPDVLLEAFARVHSSRGGTLSVLGDGTLLTPSREHAARLGLSDHVRFVGFDPNPFRWMARADVFLMTSDFEGLPNALLEAQALGVPAVSTSCPTGPDEIIQDGVTGRLVPLGDAGAFAEAVVEVTDDEVRRTAMGLAARERIRSLFEAGTVVRQWERVLSGGDDPCVV